MQYTKAMIDLVKEIRRRADSDLKPAIKLANPLLFNELADLLKVTKDAVTTALIKELLALVKESGQQYNALSQDLEEITAAASNPPARVSKKMYRGQPVY